MTAYGALISLQNTIHHTIHSSHISLVEPSLYIIQRAYEELQPFQEILGRLDSTSKSRSRKKVNALDKRIKVKLCAFEDCLESVVLQQILSQLEIPARNAFSIDLQCLYDDVRALVQTRKVMEKEYMHALGNMAEEGSISSRIGFVGAKSKMVGLSDQFEQVRNDLDDNFDRMLVYALVGMAGVGKTTLAEEVFEDPHILSIYEHRAWVKVGRKPQKITELSQGIIAQLTKGDEEMDVYFKEIIFEGKRCLVVLDDVWETKVLSSLIDSLASVKNIQILVTARERDVVENITSQRDGLNITVVRFLNDEESKDLLCHKVFGDEIYPSRLDKAATKIAKKCEGLPLTIVTVADILSKSQNRDPDYWDDVAEGRNSVFADAYNEMTKVFFPSYDYLPQCLKMPFLFMGVFPPDYDFPPSKLINMFTAEGWFHTDERRALEVSVWHCLEKLCFYKNLVLFNRKSISWHEKIEGHKYKTCRLHSTWRHVCRVEAWKNKFYHVLNRLVDASKRYVKGQRCLCLQNNILFGFKDFCKSLRLNCASTTRSLLFFGPYHQYPTPVDVGFRLLRELDALKLRFYTFPTEILTLVLLKYLALSCNGELPATISKLFNLRVLIIHPHMNIRRCGAPSYIPIQIWDMQELEHIEILGKSLVDPHHVVSLEMLSTLVGVNANTCTILDLSDRIPNIKKLGIQIELTPYDNHNDLSSCFSCISTLESLETLKCSIINPVVHYSSIVPATPSPLMFPCGLKKLHLSGMGFPWEYADAIGFLPFLQVLKLRSYAFQGSHWETQRESFLSLEFLLIEDSDLVQWIPRYGSFPKLSYLSMKHCYKLVQLYWPSHSMLGKIELVDCNPLAWTCASQLKPSPFTHLDVTASSYFDKKPVTHKLQSFGGLMPLEWEDSISSPVFLEEPKWSGSAYLFIISVIVLLGCVLRFYLIKGCVPKLGYETWGRFDLEWMHRYIMYTNLTFNVMS